jgi:hypothetical protein
MFGDLFKTASKDSTVNNELRASLAEKAAKLAADFLPAGAYLDGKQLPADHKPKTILPVVETNQQSATAAQKPTPAKSRTKKLQRQSAANQAKPRQQAI